MKKKLSLHLSIDKLTYERVRGRTDKVGNEQIPRKKDEGCKRRQEPCTILYEAPEHNSQTDMKTILYVETVRGWRTDGNVALVMGVYTMTEIVPANHSVVFLYCIDVV